MDSHHVIKSKSQDSYCVDQNDRCNYMMGLRKMKIMK